ncbi:MAG: hypothetical protein EAZ39_28060 [Oscillatoriales cyanobacterium]|uniref:hypothetical protein n=1 Tax=Microcoleus sp. PH2017_05_CCC_O_A TaxID=2798816 RepID=UPI001D340D52|nr:hypothetical protein [Microcoleus sp. PH2017_05_CCC_O_A]TAG04200.1 MAG: hypothetical protein EAZ45_08485 [Oscillatoriales cyanobacterium]MCC3438218.1 hypothetical protein [Microcoleus sp. PH2017_05_CCC_O_A]TAG13450.1 MAG: hypothetical protein EAZ39_28060 [Oscillatoriales cyanobacterium]TAG37069.1 MAG: hypothetical protein EAZ33_22370 [Oscillatoriales cyanobacterium]TAG57748.1 MAG: hypothetical protein EAZ28_17135 [Oscillatoriales cyanobacterium]
MHASAILKALILGLGVVSIGFAQVHPVMPQAVKLAQVQKAVDGVIAVSLPEEATVYLKNKVSMTGKVTGLNSKSLEVSRDGDSRSVEISQVQRVEFKRDALVYSNDGNRRIRGENQKLLTPPPWEKVPLGAFQTLNPQKGLITVDLRGVLPPQRLRGVVSMAIASDYIVDEIMFTSTERVTVKVTPYARR